MKSKFVFVVSLLLSCIAAAEGDCAGLKFVKYDADVGCKGEGTEVDNPVCYKHSYFFPYTCKNGIPDADKCISEEEYDEVFYAKYSCNEKVITLTKFEDDKCTTPKKLAYDGSTITKE